MRSLFGNSTIVPVVTASTCGTNVSLRWSMTARPGSISSNAPRGAASRYTTARVRSGWSCGDGAPSAFTVGRRSMAGG